MPWQTTGNAGTDPATNFLGTTDDQPLVIRTQALERMRITRGGHVGVGTTSPNNQLVNTAQASFGGNTSNTGTEPVEVQGAGAGVSFYDRTGGATGRWVIYSDRTGGVGTETLRFWSAGDKVTITQEGDVNVTGDLTVVGTLSKGGGSFKIDHPLDPAHKYLSHSFVESPDMKNIYDGVVTLDTNGAAEVRLPAWFDALNTDFRYQLTCLGGYAPVYIAEEIRGNCFKIAGGQAGMHVSWQVSGIRQDAWANAYRIPVEQDKLASEQDTYLYPELYGQAERQYAARVRHTELPLPTGPR